MILMARGDLSAHLGVDVEWRLFGTGPDIVSAFERGELDLAYIGLPPAVIGISRGVNIVCVAGGHIEGTVIAGKMEFIGFPDVADLHVVLGQLLGLRIGVPGKGSIHDVIISDCLERLNLAQKIAIINFQWADQALEAMVKGSVAAVVGTPALAVAVKTYAGGKILYPPSLLWPHNPSYGILADKAFLNRETDLVEKFLVQHEEATSFIRHSPPDAAQMISNYVRFVEAEFVMDVLRVSPKYCAQLTDEFISSTMEFVRALRRLGYIRREIPLREIFDTSIVRKIHPEKNHYEEGLSDLSYPELRKS